MPSNCTDLRPVFASLSLPLKSQGRRGTCSVFAVTAALEFALARRKGAGLRLSEEFLNWASNDAIDEYEDGGFFHDLWRGYEKHGICREDAAPYRDVFDSAWRPEPSALSDARGQRSTPLDWRWIKEWDVITGLTDEQFGELLSALSQGWPVCGGLRWPKAAVWSDLPTGPFAGLPVLAMCGPEEVFDGHSVLFVGCADRVDQPGGGILVFKDSRAPGAYLAMPYAFAQAYANDAGVVTAR